jgi:hypothetical protein
LNSGNQNSGDFNSGNQNSGNLNSGDLNSGDLNSGDFNSGNRNSGFFNSITPKVLIFNKETSISREKINIPFYPKVTEWISESNMTTTEKKENPKFFVSGGYLKTYNFKESCISEWKTLSEENKNIIKNLPNFDAVIFYDITGIDVSENTDKKKKEMIKEAEDLLKKGMDLMNKAKGII